MTRAWAVGDEAAVRDYRDMPWRRGIVLGIRDGWLSLRFADVQPTDVRRPVDDVRVVHEDEVPADERHWLSQDERDQLVRVEAAKRLRAMFELIDVPPHRRVADVLARISCPDDTLAAGARALLRDSRDLVASP